MSAQGLYRTCCFTGHRPPLLPDGGDEHARNMLRLRDLTERAIMLACERGVKTFYNGGARGFDMLAAEAVLTICAASPQISLVMILPGHNQSDDWPEDERARYQGILHAAREVLYAADLCSIDAMHKRNRMLVDRADLCIAYLVSARGGTLYTASYALECGIPVLNLASHDIEARLASAVW